MKPLTKAKVKFERGDGLENQTALDRNFVIFRFARILRQRFGIDLEVEPVVAQADIGPKLVAESEFVACEQADTSLLDRILAHRTHRFALLRPEQPDLRDIVVATIGTNPPAAATLGPLL